MSAAIVVLADAMPTRNLDPPSEARPLFFFHLRKCGGSTQRPVIAEKAERENLTSFVPCLERLEHNILRQSIHADCGDQHRHLSLPATESPPKTKGVVLSESKQRAKLCMREARRRSHLMSCVTYHFDLAAGTPNARPSV